MSTASGPRTSPPPTLGESPSTANRTPARSAPVGSAAVEEQVARVENECYLLQELVAHERTLLDAPATGEAPLPAHVARVVRLLDEVEERSRTTLQDATRARLRWQQGQQRLMQSAEGRALPAVRRAELQHQLEEHALATIEPLTAATREIRTHLLYTLRTFEEEHGMEQPQPAEELAEAAAPPAEPAPPPSLPPEALTDEDALRLIVQTLQLAQQIASAPSQPGTRVVLLRERPAPVPDRVASAPPAARPMPPLRDLLRRPRVWAFFLGILLLLVVLSSLISLLL